MSQSKRKDNQEFPDLKYPNFSTSGGDARSSDPLEKAGQGGENGSIFTDWTDIKWNFKKATAIGTSLAIPYLLIILATFLVGMKLIAEILLIVFVLILSLFGFVRWFK
jgi:hypothetical protein